MLRRRFLTLVSLFVLAVATSTPYTLHAQNAVTTAIGAAADGYAIVILADPPLAAWTGTARTANGKIDFASGANGRYQAALAQARNTFKQWLRSTRSPAQVLREYDTVLHGLAVRLNGATLDSLRAGPGVTIVEPSLLYSPVMNRSLDLINASAAWAAVGGVANAGAGIKVGVIDTGITRFSPTPR